MLILIATFGITLLSLSGVFFFGKKGHLVGTQRFIVPFAIGAFLAIVFLELIPETLSASSMYGPVAILAGYLLFYLLSNVLHTYHHHHDNHGSHDHCGATKATASMLLWGDSIHNVTDGIVIASAFVVNPVVGWVTTLGIALHEIPQEIAEYGVLRKVGYSAKKAAALNLASASSVFIGAGLSLFFMSFLTEYIWILTGVAAGNLLYIATSDLLPEVHTEARANGSFFSTFLATVLGVTVVGSVVMLEHILS